MNSPTSTSSLDSSLSPVQSPRHMPLVCPSQESLVVNLQKTCCIRSSSVIEAMLKTDRAHFAYSADDDLLPDNQIEETYNASRFFAYQNVPFPIGLNQTMSAPQTHGQMMELAASAIQGIKYPRILDVGCGSGYLSACFARLVEPHGGLVVGLEVHPILADLARRHLQEDARDLVDRGVVTVHCNNGWKGSPAESPFNFIYVGAAAECPPPVLIKQLAKAGKLVIPINDPHGGQTLTEFTKVSDTSTRRRVLGSTCSVPLVKPRTCHP